MTISDMEAILRSWATPVAAWVSVLAWLAKLATWALRRGSLDIHAADTVELGFNSHGITVTLSGVLRAVRRDCFVTKMTTTLTCPDQTERSLSWIAALDPKRVERFSRNLQSELPTAVLVQTRVHHQFRIMFADQSIRNSLLPLLQRVDELRSDEWRSEVFRVYLSIPLPGHTQAPMAPFDVREARAITKAQKEKLDERIRDLSYWAAGDYELRLHVSSVRPSRDFSQVWRFSISQKDSDTLRLNAFSILKAEEFGQDQWYTFVHETLREKAGR